MAIDTQHADYMNNSTYWKRCRDTISGEDKVKSRKTLYLPQPSEMEDDIYKNYIARALFFNASERTADGYQGLIFRKEPEVEVPEAFKEYLKDITLSAVPFNMFSRDVTREVIDVGRCGVLVDVQNENAQNRRPYFSMYDAESIINWKTINIDGDERLSMVVLKEIKAELDPKDEFKEVLLDQYRVLTLGPVQTNDSETGESVLSAKDVYRVRVYVKRESTEQNKSGWSLELDTIPKFANGEALTFIPFVFINSTGISPYISKPPLLDLVNVNLSHYRTSADLEWARFYIAFPQVYVTGVSGDPKLTRAANKVWKFEDVNSKVGVVGGDQINVSALEKAADKKEKLMAILGASLLEEDKREAEAAETLRLRQSGKQASLYKIAASSGYGLQQALKWAVEWSSMPSEDVTCKMNTVFIAESIDPQILTTLFDSLQAGRISYDTFYQNLIRGGLTREGVTSEMEKEDINSDIPAETM